MSEDKDLEQLKREAAAKAKAAAMAKRKAKEMAAKQEEAPKSEEPAQAQMPDADDLAKKKAAAAAKAKAAALAKKKREGMTDEPEVEAEAPTAKEATEADDLAKKKAAAAAKAKAAALAKKKREGMVDEAAVEAEAPEAKEATEADDLAKKKAAAVAKAKAAAAAKRKAMELAAGGAQAEGSAADEGDDAKAKAIAAAKAKAAAAAKAKAAAAAKAKGGKAAGAEPEADTTPSPNQPYLDKYLKVIEENMGSDVLEDSYINKLSKDVPTLVVKREYYFKLAQFLKYNELLGFDYLSELHGTDFETHMEVYVHLYSYRNRQSVAFKTKIDRDDPTIESLQPIWAGADWPECEAYDLLGIKFIGHPNLHRIFLGEDWVGHPLRKDYEPYDVEV
jgi:NADH-quinone oxidoreductase subunit C